MGVFPGINPKYFKKSNARNSRSQTIELSPDFGHRNFISGICCLEFRIFKR